MYNFCVQYVNYLWTFHSETRGYVSPTSGLVTRFVEVWWGKLNRYTKNLNSFSNDVSTLHPHGASLRISDFSYFSTTTTIKDTVIRFIKRKE
jgi:hypothetical protein